MKNRIKPFLCFMLLMCSSQSKAFLFEAFTVPVLIKGGSALVAVVSTYVLDSWFRDKKRKAKEQRLEKLHQEHINKVRSWESEDFEKQLRRESHCDEFEEIPADCLFEHYDYYQFFEFQNLLEKHPYFESYIIDLRR